MAKRVRTPPRPRKPSPNNSEWVTVPEAAAAIGHSAPTTYDEIARGRIKASRVGRAVKVARGVVEKMRIAAGLPGPFITDTNAATSVT